MAPSIPQNPATWLVPLAIIALVVLRNLRARRLRVETLWIAPVLIIALAGSALAAEGAPDAEHLAVDAIFLIAGAAIGWWRARFTRITVDPATHQLTSQGSAVGMLVILGIFALRYLLRIYAAQHASELHLPVSLIADAALTMSVGLVCAQRLEIALRATRLLNEARGAKP